MLSVRGEAGSGKTILALQLLSALSSKLKPIYISSRVTPQKLYSSYPWVKSSLPADAVVDATKPSEEGGLGMLRYIDKPSFIRALIGLLERRGEAVAAVDSVEGVKSSIGADFMDLSLEEDLIALAEGHGCRLILLYEGSKAADYLADGVVELSYSDYEGARLRRINIRKLRGYSVEKPERVFTLDGGRLRALPHSPVYRYPTGVKWKPKPEREGYFTAGIPLLDELVGGLPAGGTLLLSLEDNVPSEAVCSILYPMLADFVSKGRPIFLLPSHSVVLLPAFLSILKYFENLMDLFLHAIEKEMAGKMDKFHVVYRAGEAYSLYREWLKRCRAASGGKPVLSVVGLDTLEHRFELRDAIAALSRMVSDVRRFGWLLVLISTSSSPELSGVAATVAGRHIRLEYRLGAVVVRGVKPSTFTVAVEPLREGEAVPELVKLV
ncbi:MAG: hypothetical protein DRN99_03010 [Thermoproteota archaeon]|nr:MAG: hypothetical protein DRN99_03010 [Candidatus Korarchaeota archaeon]